MAPRKNNRKNAITKTEMLQQIAEKTDLQIELPRKDTSSNPTPKSETLAESSQKAKPNSPVLRSESSYPVTAQNSTPIMQTPYISNRQRKKAQKAAARGEIPKHILDVVNANSKAMWKNYPEDIWPEIFSNCTKTDRKGSSKEFLDEVKAAAEAALNARAPPGFCYKAVETLEEEIPNRETTPKRNSRDHSPKRPVESTKSVSNPTFHQSSFRESYTPNEMPKKKVRRRRTRSKTNPLEATLREGKGKAVETVHPEHPAPRVESPELSFPDIGQMFPDIGYTEQINPNVKTCMERSAEDVSGTHETPKSEIVQEGTVSPRDKAFNALEKRMARHQKLWTELPPIMERIIDLTEFHPLKTTMLRLFFEAICIRIDKVEALKEGIANCKEGFEYQATFFLFDNVTTHENAWIMKTGLNTRYIEILNGFSVPDACRELIRRTPKTKAAQRNTKSKCNADQKAKYTGDHVTRKDNSGKENLQEKHKAWSTKNANREVGQKTPLNDRSNQLVSRTRFNGRESPKGKEKVTSFNEKFDENIGQEGSPSGSTHKGITPAISTDKETSRGIQQLLKSEKANIVCSHKHAQDQTIRKDITGKVDPDDPTATLRQIWGKPVGDKIAKVVSDKCEIANEPTKGSTPRSYTTDEKSAWEKHLPDYDLLSGKDPDPLVNFHGVGRLENISADKFNKSVRSGEIAHGVEKRAYMSSHTAFEIIDGDPTALHAQALTFAKLLRKHQHDTEGTWKGAYEYFNPLFRYIYLGWYGMEVRGWSGTGGYGVGIESVADIEEVGAGPVEMGKWFPTMRDGRVFGWEEDEKDRVEDLRDREKRRERVGRK